MRFGPVPLQAAEGAIAAHSIRYSGGSIRKGIRLTNQHIQALRGAGITEVVAAQLEAGDVHEDDAARRIATLLAGAGVRLDAASTGRCNLYATQAGLFLPGRAAIDAVNRLDPGLTLATLREFAPVEAGRMVATVKVIPFALPDVTLDTAAELCARPALSVAPWRGLKVGLAATVLPSLKPAVLDKTRRILEERLRPAGASIVAEARVAHDTDALAEALRDLQGGGAELIIAFGASAITDIDDVIPAALRAAGGSIVHLGMPVDPGNLLLLGSLAGKPVLGAPGCARSPAENGFDWVLNRLLAGVPVAEADITGMGVGGLLMEIVSRPQPREPVDDGTGPVAAVILAAGQSRRMGGPNKLLATFDGKPLIRRVTETALRSKAGPVIVVTGHQSCDVVAALEGLDVKVTHNPDYAEGLATSLRRGVSALPQEIAGALVVLADMPQITAEIMDELIGAFRTRAKPAIVLPTAGGKRGNPVLWSREFFPELMELSGDAGARHLLGVHDTAVSQVEVGSAAALDVDTPPALAAAGGIWPPASPPPGSTQP